MAETSTPKKRLDASVVVALLFGNHTDSEDSGSSDSEVGANKDDPCDAEDFTEEGLRAKEIALSISKSVVSLVSFVDGKVLFACTGTVVDHVGSTWILTSATLVRKPDCEFDAYQGGEIKIEVHLHDKTIVEGCLAMCNLQYNVAVVTIDSKFDLPLVKLHDLPVCYSMLCRPVIAVARDSESKTLLVKRGEMIRESSKLDCNELLVCTCPVSKIFIGGLVMDFEKNIVGITFYDKDTVPFLPIEIVVKCLEHFKYFRTLKQPCLCIRGQALHKLELHNLEKICYMYPELSSGIVVEKISEVLPENCGGIEAGDIIFSIDEVVLYSMAQLTSIFLHKMLGAIHMQDTVTIKADIRRPRDNTKFVAKLNLRGIASDEYNNCFNNRWSLC